MSLGKTGFVIEVENSPFVSISTFYVFYGLSFVFEYEFFEVFLMSSNSDFL